MQGKFKGKITEAQKTELIEFLDNRGNLKIDEACEKGVRKFSYLKGMGWKTLKSSYYFWRSEREKQQLAATAAAVTPSSTSQAPQIATPIKEALERAEKQVISITLEKDETSRQRLAFEMLAELKKMRDEL